MRVTVNACTIALSTGTTWSRERGSRDARNCENALVLNAEV
jgi:hypothetical protein